MEGDELCRNIKIQLVKPNAVAPVTFSLVYVSWKKYSINSTVWPDSWIDWIISSLRIKLNNKWCISNVKLFILLFFKITFRILWDSYCCSLKFRILWDKYAKMSAQTNSISQIKLQFIEKYKYYISVVFVIFRFLAIFFSNFIIEIQFIAFWYLIEIRSQSLELVKHEH